MRSIRNVSFPISLALLIAACAGPRMVPPSDVAQGTVLEAKNRSGASGSFVNEDFDLGPYKVAKVTRGWIKGSGLKIGAFGSNKSKAEYTYELQGGSKTLKGRCSIAKDEKSMKLGGGFAMGDSRAGVACVCEDGAQVASLGVTRNPSGKFDGNMMPAGQSYTLTPVKETDKKYWGGEPAGYRIDGNDGPRGAVEMLKPGRIWYTEKMAEAERETGTCLLAGLMLYVEPSDKED